MAVGTVTIWSVHPGRAADFLKNAGAAKGIHERLGGKVRLRQIVYGGPNSGQFVYTIEHTDMTAFAAFSDKLNANAEWLAHVAATGANTTAALVSHSLTRDVPGF